MWDYVDSRALGRHSDVRENAPSGKTKDEGGVWNVEKVAIELTKRAGLSTVSHPNSQISGICDVRTSTRLVEALLAGESPRYRRKTLLTVRAGRVTGAASQQRQLVQRRATQ